MLAKECINQAYESGLNEGIRFEKRVFHSTFAYVILLYLFILEWQKGRNDSICWKKRAKMDRFIIYTNNFFLYTKLLLIKE